MPGIEIVNPTAEEMGRWPKRADGSQKGLGFFGLLKRPDGQVSSELSVGVNLAGRETEIPLLVPTLSRGELEHLLAGGKPTDDMVRKAVDFAWERIGAGKPVFATDGEQVPLPNEDEEQKAFEHGFNAVRGIHDVVNGKPAPNPNAVPLTPSVGVRG